MNRSKEVHSQPSIAMRALRIRKQIQQEALSGHTCSQVLSFVHFYIRRRQDIPGVTNKKETPWENFADEIWKDCW